MAITVEINGQTYTFRNLEEQVLFLTKELTKVQQSLGNALPDPIPGPQGEPGATGGPGPEGPRGKGFYGVTAELPSATAYKEGEFYLLFNGNVYKKINGSWILQYNIKGPQGAPGLVGGTKVVANPVGSPTDNLYKVSIDGTIYDILSSTVRTYLDNLQNYFQYDSDDEYFAFLKEVYFDQLVSFDKRVNFDGDIYFRNNTLHLPSLEQIVDNLNNPIVICEHFNDKNGNPRFVEGNITTTAKTGVTYTYAKWSLSGSHLMFVVCMTIESGTVMHNEYFASVSGLPDYIKNKLIPVWASEFMEINKFTAYDNGWNSQQLDIAIAKTDGGTVYFYQPGNVTFSSTKNIRIEFDFLIDME